MRPLSDTLMRMTAFREAGAMIGSRAGSERLTELDGFGRNPGALGALAVGFLALGALSIGRLVVSRLAIGRGRVKHLEIENLTVRHLTILDDKSRK